MIDSGLALARVAQLGGSEEMLRLLMQLGGKVDATDEFGRSAIMLAVSRRDKDMTQLLLKAGADVEGGGGTYNGRTALMQAACSGANDMVSLLLSYGADPCKTDRYGRNVIQQAAVMRREETVRILEKHLARTARGQDTSSSGGGVRGLFAFLSGRGSRGTSLVSSQGAAAAEDERKAREEQLWQSIFKESKPVEGRPEVFQWRGRVLLQPQLSADGMCVIVEETTGSIVFKGLPPSGSGGPAAATNSRVAPRTSDEAPPLPAFLRQEEAAPRDSKARTVRGAGGVGEEDSVRLDPEVERKLWRSIIAESSPVPGRADIFEWRGRRLKQPSMSEDGLCIIVEDATGEVVFKGGPPPPDIHVAQAGAGESEASLAAGYTSSTLRLMQDATRVLISPAVAVVRLSTAAVTSVTSVSSVSSPTSKGARGAAGGAPVRSVSGTISAMAAAWQSLKGGASGSGDSSGDRSGDREVKTATSTSAAIQGGGGREMRGDGVVWKDLDKHVADVRALAQQVRARGASQMVTTQRARGQSHCPRDLSYKDKTLQVHVSGLDAVIGHACILLLI